MAPQAGNPVQAEEESVTRPRLVVCGPFGPPEREGRAQPRVRTPRNSGPSRPYFACRPRPDGLMPTVGCGERIAVDEDGCCVTCGADAIVIHGRRTTRRRIWTEDGRTRRRA